MTGTLSTQTTSHMQWEPDASLLDTAREIAPIVREHSQEAEKERRLSQPVLRALRETGLLRMTTPRSLGGLETDPVTRALVGEEIGRHDSAAAWTLENPLDWAFFCCRLPDEGAEEIYSRGADILIAAQFGRPLKATSTNGGYRISGRAPFVSNCYDADWISSTVLVDVDESAGEEPETRMVYFPSEECEIIDTWDVMGMRGTGSNDISVTDVYVPKSRTFPMVPDFEPGSHYRGPLYRLPLVGAAASGIPTPMLGVARRALDEVTELARNKTPVASSGLLKERASAQVQLGRAESDPALRTPVAPRQPERSLAEMPRRQAPLAGAEGGPPARDGARHEQRRPGGRPRLRHRGNVGVSSHQPAGALLPGCPDDETSRVRL
jgi:alkylation response protein AidB-like acyl-CoA dehydrogenase